MKVIVKNCARCDQNHEIDIAAFTKHPVEDFTHFGMCQNVNEPVLVKFVDLDIEEVERV